MAKSVSSQNNKRKIIIFLIVILLIAIGTGVYFIFPDWFNKDDERRAGIYSEGDLVIHFVDVGQGDSIIIQFPDNKNMIIDGGPRSAKSDLLTYIDNLGITTFDYMLLTHSDEDHCGSLDDVILEYEIKTIFMPDTSFVSGDLIDTVVYKTFISAAEEETKDIRFSNADSDFSGVGYEMDFITPNIADYTTIFKPKGVLKKPDAEGLNSISPIIILTFADKKIMFTGDANETTEEVFLKNIKNKNKADYNVDILKIGHHGSKTSTTSEFLEIVKPEIAVIMAGTGNTYGHPTQELLARLNNCTDSNGAATVYRTDLNGDIIIKLTANGTNATIHNPVLGKGAVSSSVAILKISKDFSESLACVFINLKQTNF